MAKVNEQDLLDEIRFDIKEKDLIKARLVLSALEEVSKEAQKEALFEVSRTEDEFAIPLLAGVISNSPNVSDSFPHLKETMFSKVLDSPDVLLTLLAGQVDSLSKWFLVEIAGEIRLEKAVPFLLDFLVNEKDPKVMKSTIKALGLIGSPKAVNSISEHLYSNDLEIIYTAVQALGEIGTPESIHKLVDKLGKDSELDITIIDLFAKIQIQEALEKLNELLESEHAHIRAACKKKLGEIGAISVRVLIKNLKSDNPDLVIHSLNVLGDIGDKAAIPAIRNLLHNDPKDPNIRFAAYEALGRLPVDNGAFTLAGGLEDPVDNVRSAAAKAIDNNYNAVLAGGVRNLIKSGNASAINIIVTIINSQCDSIFMDLLEDDYFTDPAMKYLTDKAHPDVQAHFAKSLSESGHNALAKKITKGEKPKGKGKLKIFAIDDSKMILSIYRTVLHNLGYDSQLFEFPAEALEHLNKEKPDVILTDLNMPDITGIDLTRNVRKSHTKETLPIIMVTTQDEAKDNDSAYKAGVNGILQKPFTESQIGKTIEKVTPK